MDKMENQFRTKDLYEASALYALNIPLSTLEFDNKQYWFLFDEQEKCRKLSDEYWRGTLMVNAKDYADAIRTLKDRVFAQKD